MITRLFIEDFDKLYQVYSEHATFQGLPAISSFWTIKHKIKDAWHEFHSTAILDNNNYYFADIENNKILAFVIFRKWIQNGIPVCTLSWMVSNKQEILLKSHGGAYWPDSIINIVNYAVDLFDKEGITTFYTFRTKANSKWIPISSLSACILSTYTEKAIEHILAGEYSVDPDVRKYVSTARLSTAQVLVRFTKP